MVKLLHDWDSTKAGTNLFDELHRALHDLIRLTGIWERIADENADRLTGEPPQIEELLHHTRENWGYWEPAIKRAFDAIESTDLERCGLEKRDLINAVGLLHRIFHPPMILIGDEQLGDHLILRGAGPLAWSKSVGSLFPAHEVRTTCEILSTACDAARLTAATTGGVEDPAGGIETNLQLNGSHKGIGLTKSQLCDLAKISSGTFDKIREAAGLPPSKRGSGGQTRRFKPNEIEEMIHAVESGSFRDSDNILNEWKLLLSSHRRSKQEA